MSKCATKFYDKVISIFTSAAILFAALAWRDCGIVYVNNHPEVKSHGAYAYAMASNYNSKYRCPELLIEDGEAKLVRRRETAEDLLRLENIPS